MRTTRRLPWLWLALSLLLGGGVSCALLPPNVAPTPVTPKATPTPVPAPQVRVWVSPVWGPGTPGGSVLAEVLDGWASRKGVTLVLRVFTREEMRALMASVSLVAPQARPHLLLVDQALVETWVQGEHLAGLPREDPWTQRVTETPWFPYARATVWLGGGFYALPWAGNAWTLWVLPEDKDAWAQRPWTAWSEDPNAWALPTGLEEPWPLWSLYRAAGGVFPPSPQRPSDREALTQVLTLLAESRTREALPRQALQWRTVEDLLAFGTEVDMWLLPYAQGARGGNRVPLWIPNPEGEPGPIPGWVYAWVMPRGLDERARALALDLLAELQQPQVMVQVALEGKWLPVARLDPWPEAFPWPPEDLERLDARPGPEVMGDWHARLAQVADEVLRGLREPVEGVEALLGTEEAPAGE